MPQPSPARVARDVQAAVHHIGARRVFVASDTDASDYMELLRNNVTQRPYPRDCATVVRWSCKHVVLSCDLQAAEAAWRL